MKKWTIGLIVFVFVVGITATAFGLIKNKREVASTPVIETQTAVAEIGNIAITVNGTGSISSINKEIISSNDNATVEEVLIEEGDTVEEGDELITFEEDIDSIEAPFSGEVTTLSVEEDKSVAMGTEMVEVTNYNNLEMIVNVDELDISKVAVGQAAKIEVTALPDQEFTGTVTGVAKEANEESESSVSKYAVNVKIENPKGIKVGMTAEATITTESKENIVTVPIEAVQKEGNQYFVQVPVEENAALEDETKADEENDEPQMTQKTVEVGLQNEDVAEVTNGLTEGEEVILPTLPSSDDAENMRNMFQNSGFPGGGMPGGENMRQGGMRQGGNGGEDGQ
ncbi:efflux RND transporter periplasmic adaptor subunit [Metabacillus herbersteinensis]|uniref:Efflux RND transporter periplasmic adaptor subunit n=1 Tax=Metabacillus herbersteinensis TaxID=283816 RepID=A0ABV6GBW1_9BACI